MTHPPKPSLWGKGVWMLYGAFVLFILALVGWAAAQRFDLVEPDYYARGLAYQQRIDQVRRAKAADDIPNVRFDASQRIVTVCFAGRGEPIQGGTIHFFRPSDAQLDFDVALTLDSLGCQRIADGRLRQGKWTLKYEWTTASGVRYWEDMVYIEF